MRRSRPDLTITSHRSPACRLAQSIRATSFDEPSAQTACRFVSASGRIPANETRCGEFCFVGLMLFYPFGCQATAGLSAEARSLYLRPDDARIFEEVVPVWEQLYRAK